MARNVGLVGLWLCHLLLWAVRLRHLPEPPLAHPENGRV